MVTNVVYIIWASGETQPFNTPHLMGKTPAEIVPASIMAADDLTKNNNSTNEKDEEKQH